MSSPMERFCAIAHPVFDLCEGFLDPIEIGRTRRQIQTLAPAALIMWCSSAGLWLLSLFMMTMSPDLRTGTSC